MNLKTLVTNEHSDPGSRESLAALKERIVSHLAGATTTT